MNIFFYNVVLTVGVTFFSKYCCIEKDLSKQNLKFLAFIVSTFKVEEFLPSFSKEEILDPFVRKELKGIWQKDNFLLPFKTSGKIIEDFYPKKLLKIKDIPKNEDIFLNKTNYDPYFAFLFFIGLFFILFTIYENKIKDLKPKSGLKQKMGSFTKTVLLQSLKLFFLNEYIYYSKVKEQEREKTVIFCCKHYFLEVKEGYIFILTRDFTSFNLFSGMECIVIKVLLNQQLEVSFILTSKTIKNLEKFQTTLISKNDLKK